MKKIAQITAIFWVMKICATTLGETGGDWLAQTLKVGYSISSIIFFSIFLISLVFQLSAKKFHPFLYWAVILTTSTAGTTISDYMDRTLGLGYATGSAILVSILIVIFAIWYKTEKTLNINHIETRRAETFYWIAILFSNTLGTALGDFIADSSGLGYIGGASIIGISLLLLLLGYYFTQIPRVILFWLAFVLTRPFGATFGDLLTKSHEKGGMNLGTSGSSLVLLAILLILVTYTAVQKNQKNRNNELTISH